MSDEHASHQPHSEDGTRTHDKDAELARALASADRDAAARLLVEHHAAVVGRLCMALLGSQAEAEDALRECLLAALEQAPSPLRVGLLGSARRLCARRLAERARPRKPSDAEGSPPVAEVGERVSMARRARQLLQTLKPTEREALLLRFTSGLGFRELGLACEIDEAAARKRVARGISRIRSGWEEAKS